AVTPITGYAAAELQTFDDLMAHAHPDDLPALRDHLGRVVAGTRDSRDFRLTTRLGDQRVLRLHARPEHPSESGQVRRVYGAVQDLTEQRRSELALQQT